MGDDVFLWVIWRSDLGDNEEMRTQNKLYRVWMAGLICGAVLMVCGEAGGGEELRYGVAESYALVMNRDIRESSGVAWGWRNGDVLWTHNDSGAAPVIFGIGPMGEDRGMFTLGGARSIDWEDMASFEVDGVGWLVLGDVGDNFLNRPYYSLYFVKEPEARGEAKTGKVRVEKVLRFRYEDGARNCEAIAVDAKGERVYLATKNVFGETGIYELEIPKVPTGQLRAKRIGEVWLNSVTAMDMSADGKRAVLLTYGPAYEFVRGEGESWADAFGREGRRLATPYRKQGESICYGPDSRTLYFTNESRYSPLWRMEVGE